MWERRQAELWDRIFQVTQDVVTLAESLRGSPGMRELRGALLKCAMVVGAELVRANAADTPIDFERCVREARLKAIEADYWLRLVYVIERKEAVQRDLSSIIAQYAAIIGLLQRFIRHTHGEVNVLRRHGKGPLVS